MNRKPTASARTRLLAAAFALAILPGTARADDRSNDCLDCHADLEGEVVRFPDGSTLDVFVSADAWNASAHAEQLDCQSCHRQISDYPHPDRTAPSAREYQLQNGEQCNRCHYAYFTRVIDGIHYQQLEEGNLQTAMCVDCHGAHDTMAPSTWRADVDRRCASCHEDISTTYRESVHGAALLEEGNEDVPVCTDCHGAHDIADPTDAGFHSGEHNICARCHSDAERMARYDLNPNVYQTYLDDFHGASNELYSLGLGTPDTPLASCPDCHGVHDIQPFDDSGTRQEVRARVAETCRGCHEDVPDAFADAWMSHYEPTWKTAPLVAGIKLAYRILIPLILFGLVMHILLHLHRAPTRPY